MIAGPAPLRQSTGHRRRRGGLCRAARLWVLGLFLALAAGGCGGARTQPAGPAAGEAVMDGAEVIAADGYRLPLRRWLPDTAPIAIVLGLHGFSDYGQGFGALETPLAEGLGMALYAYDQRGFGATADPGIWPGVDTLVADARAVAQLLRRRHPGLPLYVIGESMGAAVALLAFPGDGVGPQPDGLVLLAPAIWSYDAMPWYQRAVLALAVRLAPSLYLSSSLARDIGVEPTDDPVWRRRLLDDPLVQKGARVDALQGAAELMDRAAAAPPPLAPTLVLLGARDRVIPPPASCAWLRRIGERAPSQLRVAVYGDGYHLLTRYTGSAKVIADISSWLQDKTARLPSQREQSLAAAESLLCG